MATSTTTEATMMATNLNQKKSKASALFGRIPQLLYFDSLNIPSGRIENSSHYALSLSQEEQQRCNNGHSFPPKIVLVGHQILWNPMNQNNQNLNDGKNIYVGQHLTSEQLEPYRMVGDTPLDQILHQLDEEGRSLGPGDDLFDSILTKPPLHDGKAENTTYPPSIQQKIDHLFEHYSRLPSWVDTDQLQRGQRVFHRYSAAISLSLYYRSLIPGFGAPRITKVMQTTAYLTPPSSTKDITNRLLDTGLFLTACMKSINELVIPQKKSYNQEEDQERCRETVLPPKGWMAVWHVRLLHAKIRRALLRRTGKDRKWDCQKDGIPINQEDLAVTLLAFSYNSILGVEFITGFQMSMQEQEDYLALWRYIGWLLGVFVEDDPPEWMTPKKPTKCYVSVSDQKPITINPATNASNTTPQSKSLRALDPCGPGWLYHRPSSIGHAKFMLQSMLLHLLRPDQSSIVVVHHLLQIGRSKYYDTSSISKESTTQDNESNKEKVSCITTSKYTSAAAIQRKKDEKKMKTKMKDGKGIVFYYCALTCRAFVGDSFADALELPRHPNPGVRIILSASLFIFLWMIRIYTWLAFMPIVKEILIRSHLNGLAQFQDAWGEDHNSRMGTELKKKRQMASSSCPFAMIRPPQEQVDQYT